MALNEYDRIYEELAQRLARDVHFENFLLNDREDLVVIPCCNAPRGTNCQAYVCDELLYKFTTVPFVAVYGDIEFNIQQWYLASNLSYVETEDRRFDLRTLPNKDKDLIVNSGHLRIYNQTIWNG